MENIETEAVPIVKEMKWIKGIVSRDRYFFKDNQIKSEIFVCALMIFKILE